MGGRDENHATTRVAVLETRRLVRQALSLWLQAQPEIELVASADTTAPLSHLCHRRQLDGVLVGVPDEPESILRAVEPLSRRFPEVRLIAVSDADAPHSERILAHGFRTVLSPGAGAGNLLRVLSADSLVRTFNKPPESVRPATPLTPRETQVLSLVSAGSTSGDISAELGISRSTVANHKERIFDKLEAKNQAHAVARAVSLGLISPSGRRRGTRRAV